MKSWLIYWIIGCIFTGVVIGRALEKCPKDNIELYKVSLAILVWPALIIGAISSPTIPLECHKVP